MKIAARFKTWIGSHKKITATIVIALIVLSYGIVHAMNTANTDTQYVSAVAKRGNITTTIDGSGQVASSNEVSLSPKASGEIVAISVKAGQEVKAGTVIARLDADDAA